MLAAAASCGTLLLWATQRCPTDEAGVYSRAAARRQPLRAHIRQPVAEWGAQDALHHASPCMASFVWRGRLRVPPSEAHVAGCRNARCTSFSSPLTSRLVCPVYGCWRTPHVAAKRVVASAARSCPCDIRMHVRHFTPALQSI
eukprot:TRINITY_DN18405_c0_g1_i1.p2 TRINITY_DN18405_c0_g1~~TRINITY_DN18405_c0_g1_i1.p2  ORF type:complete len:143 (+),score=5.19 TRINITY_DN18405_c0_g1_i1:403-831(+)